jgi:hypothetical protein
MRKLFLSALVLSVAFASCKKSSDEATTCGVTVAAVAGNYKITKIMISSLGVNQDITNDVLTDCEKNAVINLKSDKTATYTESGTGCSATDSGTWDINSGTISGSVGTLDFAGASIANNCTNIVITESLLSGTQTYTLTRQ